MLQLCLAANDRSELRGYIGITPDQPIVISGYAASPLQVEIWQFDPNSMAVDDNISVLKPTVTLSTDPGRYIRTSTTGISAKSFNNSPGRSLTTGTGATGFRPSATRDSMVNYSITVGTSVSLTGNSSGQVLLEICPTNSANAGDWIEVGRVASGQSGSLVVGLVLNQTGGGQIGALIPAGYYVKIRTVNVSGTPTFTINSQQEVQF